jgi:hypothetical protein
MRIYSSAHLHRYLSAGCLLRVHVQRAASLCTLPSEDRLLEKTTIVAVCDVPSAGRLSLQEHMQRETESLIAMCRATAQWAQCLTLKNLMMTEVQKSHNHYVNIGNNVNCWSALLLLVFVLVCDLLITYSFSLHYVHSVVRVLVALNQYLNV